MNNRDIQEPVRSINRNNVPTNTLQGGQNYQNNQQQRPPQQLEQPSSQNEETGVMNSNLLD